MKYSAPGKKYNVLKLFIFLIVCLGMATGVYAQDSVPRPTDVKVLGERKDRYGNTLRTIQYRQGRDIITETQIIRPNSYYTRPINPDTLNKDSVMVMVDKSKYTVEVFYKRKKIRVYKAVFGPRPQENKLMAGDRATPEGWFKIQNKNPNSKYDKFILLNYPNDSSIARFNRLKAAGQLPATAKIGGDIGIHGIWKGGDDMIEMGVCWTDGCVALKNKDIEELYTFVGVGTTVYIKK